MSREEYQAVYEEGKDWGHVMQNDCYACGLTFNTIVDILCHTPCFMDSKFFKPKSSAMFHCPLHSDCGFKCRTILDLKTHLIQTVNERPFFCLDCGKTFCQKNELFSHISTHRLEVAVITGIEALAKVRDITPDMIIIHDVETTDHEEDRPISATEKPVHQETEVDDVNNRGLCTTSSIGSSE